MSSRRRTAQHAPKGGDDGRLRSPDGGNGLIILPPAPKALVELDELFALSHLRGRVLFLQIVELTLGIDDIEKIGETPIVSAGGQIAAPFPRHHRRAQFLHAYLLC